MRCILIHFFLLLNFCVMHAFLFYSFNNVFVKWTVWSCVCVILVSILSSKKFSYREERERHDDVYTQQQQMRHNIVCEINLANKGGSFLQALYRNVCKNHVMHVFLLAFSLYISYKNSQTFILFFYILP